MKKGFTLIEVSVVIAAIAILLSISTISLTTLQQHTYVETTLETLLSDIKHQQLKAMAGDTEGSGGADVYGIHFDTNQYVLFKGPTFDGTDPLNFAVAINDSLDFTNNLFPGGELVFEKGSGEVVGFDGSNNAITIFNTLKSESQTITVNRYGVITSVN